MFMHGLGLAAAIEKGGPEGNQKRKGRLGFARNCLECILTAEPKHSSRL